MWSIITIDIFLFLDVSCQMQKGFLTANFKSSLLTLDSFYIQQSAKNSKKKKKGEPNY